MLLRFRRQAGNATRLKSRCWRGCVLALPSFRCGLHALAGGHFLYPAGIPLRSLLPPSRCFSLSSNLLLPPLQREIPHLYLLITPRHQVLSSHQPPGQLSGHPWLLRATQPDTTHLESAHTPSIKALGPPDRLPFSFTSDSSCKLQVLMLCPLCPTWTPSWGWGFSQPSRLSFDHLLEQRTQLKEVHSLLSPVYAKRFKS